VAVALVVIPAGAQAPTTLSFKEVNKGGTFKIVDVPPKRKSRRAAPSAGDGFVFTNPLQKSATTTAGSLHAHCTVTKGGKRFSSLIVLCDAAFKFGNGTIYVSTLTKLTQKTTVGAVTGGDGAYAGARGRSSRRPSRAGRRTRSTCSPERAPHSGAGRRAAPPRRPPAWGLLHGRTSRFRCRSKFVSLAVPPHVPVAMWDRIAKFAAS
jgi:hypothetical protein